MHNRAINGLQDYLQCKINQTTYPELKCQRDKTSVVSPFWFISWIVSCITAVISQIILTCHSSTYKKDSKKRKQNRKDEALIKKTQYNNNIIKKNINNNNNNTIIIQKTPNIYNSNNNNRSSLLNVTPMMPDNDNITPLTHPIKTKNKKITKTFVNSNSLKKLDINLKEIN